MSHSESSNWLFQKFKAIINKDGQGTFNPNFSYWSIWSKYLFHPFDLFDLIEFTTVWRFYPNITHCVGITGYWSEAIFTISLQKNIAFANLFETSFGSNIFASLTEFQCQGTDIFSFIRVQTFEIHIQGNFLHK